MSIKFHILTASKDIIPFKAEFKGVTESAVVSVKKLLPIKDVDIIFYNNPGATFYEGEMGGIGGFTQDAHTMFISLNPRHPNFKNALENELFFMLAHELNHTIRWQKQVEGDTLLEAMIFEGLADHFAMEVTGRRKLTSYSDALTPEQKKTFTKKAKEVWKKPTYNHKEWFYGSAPDIIPRWTGYTLGYDLVANYLQAHPETLPPKLVRADATLFIERV